MERIGSDFPYFAEQQLKIRDKSGKLIPFKLNKAQQYIQKCVDDQLKSNGKIRLAVLKGRQQGLSTFIGGYLYHRTLNNPGTLTFIFAHDSDGSQSLYQMVKTFHNEGVYDDLKPKLGTSSAKELTFPNLRSAYRVGTAGTSGLGRSKTIQQLHWCISPDSLLVTKAGLTKASDIRVGDEVITHTHQRASISAISTTVRSGIRIKARGTPDALIVSPKHRLLTSDGWKEAGNIVLSDVLLYPVQSINEGGDYNLGRLLGLYVAEGHLKKQHKHNSYASVSFTVHRKEVGRTLDWIEPFKHLTTTVTVKHRNDCFTSTVTCYGKDFTALFVRCGRTTTKLFPMDWLEMGADYTRGLIHGYASGDGHIESRNRIFRATSICSMVTVQLRDMLASCGYGWAGIKTKPASLRYGRNEKEAYILTLCGLGVNSLAEEIGGTPPPRQRKSGGGFGGKGSTKIIDGYAHIPINSIDIGSDIQMVDFEVAHSDHSYLLLQCASHNSEVAYSPNCEEHAKGVMQAVPDADNTAIFLESTSNGQGDFFYRTCMQALSGEGDFELVFIPWYWQGEYIRAKPEGWELLPEEYEMLESFGKDGLTEGHLVWRRHKIISDFQGYAHLFKREYPFTPQEAFEADDEESFIKAHIVRRARDHDLIPTDAPLIFGVDPARLGGDRFKICHRKGRNVTKMTTLPPCDIETAKQLLKQEIEKHKPVIVNIDCGGLGVAVFDGLRADGYAGIVRKVDFGGKAHNPDRFKNRRAEMYNAARDWLMDEPCCIDLDEKTADQLQSELAIVKPKWINNSQLIMMPKEDIKKELGFSPDNSDAFVLTLAQPIAKTATQAGMQHISTPVTRQPTWSPI